ncbi:hypothetical protein BB987_19560 [Photorhabdus temperata]|uniref:RES domain-containing protein n=1 Tax=Photorhabdus khanii NC19 TaxID=1004151 RepID=W3V0E1_9GAMM|nr:RES family NAD+ phosphorylase [Photorhabdus khanii]ETS29273.1 hypothetical protein PTE_04495 [Photorhabdus khanii NC19]OHV49446.1 hypothetical protein BB987_19560 [Photorhabdus temperata]
MIFYRLTKSIYANDAWSGNGAKLYGGRWNYKGYSAIYVSTSIALAALEMLVHTRKEKLFDNYSLFSITIPDEHVDYLEHKYLPEDWKRDPASVSTMEIGTGWINVNESLALIIPSCIIPNENNAIINPHHPAFNDALASVKGIDFTFDSRLAL